MANGIISGLAVVGIIWIVKLIYQYVISPQIQRLSYHGVKIEGEWLTTFGEQQERPYREKVVLKRHGTSVKGTIECIECGETKEDLGKKYNLNGFFRNNFLHCTYFIGDQTRLDLGCFCLQLTTDGNSLEGYCISYHHPSGTLKPLGYSWRKSPN